MARALLTAKTYQFKFNDMYVNDRKWRLKQLSKLDMKFEANIEFMEILSLHKIQLSEVTSWNTELTTSAFFFHVNFQHQKLIVVHFLLPDPKTDQGNLFFYDGIHQEIE